MPSDPNYQIRFFGHQAGWAVPRAPALVYAWHSLDLPGVSIIYTLDCDHRIISPDLGRDGKPQALTRWYGTALAFTSTQWASTVVKDVNGYLTIDGMVLAFDKDEKIGTFLHDTLPSGQKLRTIALRAVNAIPVENKFYPTLPPRASVSTTTPSPDANCKARRYRVQFTTPRYEVLYLTNGIDIYENAAQVRQFAESKVYTLTCSNELTVEVSGGTLLYAKNVGGVLAFEPLSGSPDTLKMKVEEDLSVKFGDNMVSTAYDTAWGYVWMSGGYPPDVRLEDLTVKLIPLS